MSNETIAIIILILGALVAFMAVVTIARKVSLMGKKGAAVGIKKSKEMLITIGENIEAKKQLALERRLRNIVADELVRELVRKAIRDGIDPDTYQPCGVCLGEGCAKCNNSGWLKS